MGVDRHGGLRRRTRRTHRGRSRRRVIATVAIATIAVLMGVRDSTRPSPVAFTIASDITLPAPRVTHPVYAYSVVPGGVHAAREVVAAMAREPIVADHYRAVVLNAVRSERLAADRTAYVSYRKGEQIFWTKRRVQLHQGEAILTDGLTEIRARCGNRISETPMTPTAEDEPEETAFEALRERVGDPPAVTPYGAPVDPEAAAVLPGRVPLLPGPAAIAPDAVSNAAPAAGAAGRPGLLGIVDPPAIGLLSGGSGGDRDRGPAPPPTPVVPLLPVDGGSGPHDGSQGPPDAAINPPPEVLPVPEPGTIVLVGGGAAGLILREIRRRKGPPPA